MKSKILLLLIILFSVILRFVSLDKTPLSLNIDEVSIGYDAFSVLKTGYDQHHNFMPLVFPSLGDYKLSPYIYLSAISESFFGVNEFSVRFTSALAGVFGILAIYLASLELFKKPKIAILSAFLLTISPLHLRLSRTALEANLALTIFLFAVFFSLSAIRNKKPPLVSMLLFALTTYVYNSYKIISPLIIVYLLINYFQTNWSLKYKQFFFTSIVLFLSFLPQLILLTDSRNQSRASSTIFLKDPEIAQVLSSVSDSGFISKTYIYFENIFSKYIQYLDPSFLFLNGSDLVRQTFQDFGILFVIDFFLILFSVYIFIKRKPISPDLLRFIVFILILTPIPAAITINNYHLLRTYPLIMPLILLTSYGLHNLPKVLKYLSLFLYLLLLLRFLDFYVNHNPYQREEWMFHPSKQMALSVLKHKESYDKVIIDPRFGKLGPDIINTPDQYLYFYGQVDPKIVWAKKDGILLGNVLIREIDYPQDRKLKNTLLVGSPWSLPDNEGRIIDKIYYLNGQLAYILIAN